MRGLGIRESQMTVARVELAPGPVERLRGEPSVAQRIESICTVAERVLDDAAAARHDQQLAWIVLRDRGWPVERPKVGVGLKPVLGWLRSWSHFVSLPVRIDTAADLIRSQLISRHLDRWEMALLPVLPEPVRRLVTPLDRTGRATLSCLLQALEAWCLATSQCETLSKEKQRLAVTFAALAPEVRRLGLKVPLAPLDLGAWAAIAASARSTAPAADQSATA